MGFLNAKVKSKETTNTNYTDASNVAAGGDGSIAAGAGAIVNINTLDGGAIDRSFDFADSALDVVDAGARQAFSFADASARRSFDFADSALDRASETAARSSTAVQSAFEQVQNAYSRAQSGTEGLAVKYATNIGLALAALAALYLMTKGK